MQHVDGPAHVERLPQPARARGLRVQVKPGRLVQCSERLDGIVGHRWRRRDIGQRPSVRLPETQLAVELSFDLIALLVDGAVMSPSTSTVHAPQTPCSHPTCVPVSRSCSRSASTSVVRASTLT